jgi:hypothetical protein
MFLKIKQKKISIALTMYTYYFSFINNCICINQNFIKIYTYKKNKYMLLDKS